MTMVGSEIEQLIKMLSRLPGLGPRSCRRVALSLLDKRETLLKPLISALSTAEKAVVACGKELNPLPVLTLLRTERMCPAVFVLP